MDPSHVSHSIEFDMSINLTTIIGIVVWLVTIAIAWTKIGGRIDMLELRVSNVEKLLEKMASVLETQRSNEKSLILVTEQVASLQKECAILHETVEGLRKGEGYITGPRRGNIQGEYSRAGG